MQTVVRGGVEVGELAADQERLRRAGRLARGEDEGARAGHRDAARLLDDAGQRERPARELLDDVRVGRLLVELRVRVAGRRTRAVPGAGRQFGGGRHRATA